jgi:thiamine kinase-like enzyme
VRIIDYEYAGNNDPCFELSNLWSEATLPLPLLDTLVTAYYRRPRPAQVARAATRRSCTDSATPRCSTAR